MRIGYARSSTALPRVPPPPPLLSDAADLQALHEIGVFHLDVKPENILVLHKTSSTKLIDFGHSQIAAVSGCRASTYGSVFYSAPEIRLARDFDCEKADVWALGVVLYGMITGCGILFDHFHRVKWPRNMEVPEVLKGGGPDGSLLTRALDLVSRMLTPIPAKRPSVADVLSHEWLNESLQRDPAVFVRANKG
jgi:serine/threonine protein kinase